MPKIHSKLSEIEFKDERLVESIERIVTAIELQEALQRLLEQAEEILDLQEEIELILAKHDRNN